MTQIVYVTSPESQQIYVWKLNKKNDVLELLQVMCTPGQAQPIVVHPSKRFLYVGIRPDFKIITYTINQFGLLKDIGNTKIFSSPTYLSSNEEGTFLYCASYQYNSVSVLPICTGIPKIPVQIVEGLFGCHAANTDKHRQLLWIPCLKDNIIRLFKINKSGIITVFNPNYMRSNIASGPRHIVFHNIDCYAYVINELNSTIDVIYYDCILNAPNIVQTINIVPEEIIHTTQRWGADIHITPNGRWLYCSDRAVNIISCFEISYKTRQLKFITYQLTEIQPRGFSIDSTGEFLIAAGQKSNHISLYRINPDNGKLAISSRHYSGQGPIWVEIIEL